ncbi:hypothetical protein L218DRAFT_928843 [Marasmius fiardii PR-910]|nr:hypothetical protein L218DRAFT_928843 [Marasmius fiardii PR-910]
MNLSWRRVTINEDLPSFSTFTKPIEKPLQDDREYRIIRLENGLEATLISDAKADKAAASLDVTVGHISDPNDMPGLAHFCEHLLFMGTKTYPIENEYKSYLAKNNGYSNASTFVSNTNYYFEVSAQHLSGALARFSAFFHCPLFSPSSTARELKAVDSEYKKKHQLDSRRAFQLEKHLSKAGHPYRKFGTGNIDALSKKARELQEAGKLPADDGSSEDDPDGGVIGREIRRRLVEWWENEYCAGRMHLCVVGKETLDELSELVVTLFTPIPNRQREPLPSVDDNSLGANEKGTIIFMQSITNIHQLKISFPLEPQNRHWRHKPAGFISHFVRHEGPGSLFSYLKTKGWASGLSSGPSEMGRGFSKFSITITLTKDGFENYEAVLIGLFKYLNLLRSQTIFEGYHQQEIASLSSTKFKFLQKETPSDYVQEISRGMEEPYPRELLIAAERRTWDWGDDYEGEAIGGGAEDKVKEYLKGFVAENVRVLLMGKEEELIKLKGMEGAQWLEEPWYSTRYVVEKLAEDFIALCSDGTLPDFCLPERNRFVPENLEVEKKKVPEPAKRPYLVLDTHLCKLWHKEDDRFWVPKAWVAFEIKSPFVDQSSKTAVLTRLFTDLANDSLTEYSYAASLSGLSYGLYPITNGVCLFFEGYNDKMSLLAKQVCERIKNLSVNPDRLKIMMEKAKKGWINFFLGEPYIISTDYVSTTLSAQGWLREELLEQLPSISPEDVQSHGKLLFSQVHMKIVALGNITKEEAIEFVKIAEGAVGGPLLNSEFTDLNEFALVLPEGGNFIYSKKVSNPEQVNNAITTYLHVGCVYGAKSTLRIVASLLAQIMGEPAKNVLRTKEQLGYVVFCTGRYLPGATMFGIRTIVQSEKSPQYLDTRVEAFFEYMKGYIEEMSEEVFGEHKAGLGKMWTEEHKNLYEELVAYWGYITTGSLNFYQGENDAKALAEITKEDVLRCFMRYVHPSSKSRAKFSVYIHAGASELGSPPSEQNSNGESGGRPTYITDLAEFRKSLERSGKYPPAVVWDNIPLQNRL